MDSIGFAYFGSVPLRHRFLAREQRLHRPKSVCSRIISHKLAARGTRTHPAMSAKRQLPTEIPQSLQSLRVLGLGMAGIDILARVDKFPQPEEKIRTSSTSVFGGGNTANTLTAVRRLGIACSLITQLGEDVYGRAALQELQDDGVDTSFTLSKTGINTSFTYVIVDTSSGTRTCIATPSNEDLSPTEITEQMLDSISLLVLDGRHTLAALQLAKYARRKGVPILIDVERDRPFIRHLLPYADYIVTNSQYPCVFAPNSFGQVDAMQTLLKECNAEFVISTLGELGSLMVQKAKPRKQSQNFDVRVESTVVKDQRTSNTYEVLKCPASRVENIVDTTGAGDAFIGGVVYALVTQMPHEQMLCLASRVAGAKIGGVGSRSALPRREDIQQKLLASFLNS